MMTYCGNSLCQQRVWRFQQTYCEDCGTEMTPALKCLCGEEVNPKYLVWLLRECQTVKHCRHCGILLTEDYLSLLVTHNFKQVVKEVADALDTNRLIKRQPTTNGSSATQQRVA